MKEAHRDTHRQAPLDPYLRQFEQYLGFTPERMVRAASVEIGFLTINPALTFRMMPGLDQGAFMDSGASNFGRRMVPRTQKKINELLYRGSENEDAFRDALYARLDRIGEEFHRNERSFTYQWGQKDVLVSEQNGFNTDRPKQLLHIVEDAYAGEKRRTGESKIVHTWRCLWDALDLIEYNGRKEVPDKWYYPFTSVSAELLINAIITHDLFEIEKDSEGKKLRYAGSEFVSTWPPDSGKDGLFINVYKKENQPQDDAVIPEISSRHHIAGIDSDYLSIYRQVFRALDSSRDMAAAASGDSAHHTIETSREYKRKFRFADYDQRLLQLADYLAKVIDRRDNMLTVSYVLKDGTEPGKVGSYKAAKPDYIARKAAKSLIEFSPMERSVEWNLSELGRRYYLDLFTGGALIESMLHTDVAEFMPSTAAMKLLFGVGPGVGEDMDDHERVIYMY